MEKFRDKIFNEEVFEMYRNTLPSTKENSLIKSGLFTNVNEYKAKMSEQSGGYAVVEPIEGRIGGTPVNYDGSTNITSTSTTTFEKGVVVFGRAKAWTEKDFSYDKIFTENSTQEEIFEISGKKVCDSALEGYNGTIFAYGQTGTDIYNGR